MGGLEATLKNKDMRNFVEGELHMMTFLLCEKVDAFSVKWGEKAKNPKNFSEVAQEMKTLKRQIKEYVDRKAQPSSHRETPIEKGALEFYLQKKLNGRFSRWQPFSPELSSKKTFKEKLDFCISMEPSKIEEIVDKVPLDDKTNKALSRLFNVKDKNATWGVEPDKTGKFYAGKKIRDEMMNYAIILDALAGGAEKPVKEQLKDFKYITLRSEDVIARFKDNPVSLI